MLPATDCDLQALGLIVYVELQAQYVPIELQGVFLSALYVKDCAKHPTQEDFCCKKQAKMNVDNFFWLTFSCRAVSHASIKET